MGIQSLADGPGRGIIEEADASFTSMISWMDARDEHVRPTVERFVGDRDLDVPLDAASQPGFVEYGTAALFAELEGLSDSELVARFGSRHQASGGLKAVVVREVAQRLSAAGLDVSQDLLDPDDEGYDKQMRAWIGVHGLGRVTWSYFRLLIGREAVKPDIMVSRWVAAAVARERVSPSEATEALERLAERLGTGRRVVDHAVWRLESGRRQ